MHVRAEDREGGSVVLLWFGERAGCCYCVLHWIGSIVFLFLGIDIHGMEFASPLWGSNRYYGQREDGRWCFEELVTCIILFCFVLG